MAKSEKWGHASDVRIITYFDWFVGTEKFTVTSPPTGEVFYRSKWAKTMWAFNDPTASVVGWHSKRSNRHRKHFQTREEAMDFALEKMEDYDRSISSKRPSE